MSGQQQAGQTVTAGSHSSAPRWASFEGLVTHRHRGVARPGGRTAAPPDDGTSKLLAKSRKFGAACPVARRTGFSAATGIGSAAVRDGARRQVMHGRGARIVVSGRVVPPLQGAVMLGCVLVAAPCPPPWHELCKRRRRKFSVRAGWFAGRAPGQGCPLQLAVSPTRRSGSLVQWSTRRSPCTTGGSNVVGVD